MQHFESNLGSQKFFSWVLPLLVDIAPSYYHKQFKGKLVNQTWEMAKNLILDPILACLAQAQIWATKLLLWVLPLLKV